MRHVFIFLALWLGLILDSTLFQIPPINVIQPNLVLIVLVMIALVYGPRTALIYGIAIGLLQDIDYGRFLGVDAFTYGLIGYFSGTVFRQFMHRSIALTFFLAVCFTFVQQWITYGLTRLFDVTAYGLSTVMRHTMLVMIVNGVFLLVLYPLLIRLMESHKQPRYKTVDGERIP